MTPAEQHDATVDAVAAALRDFFGAAGEWAVFTRVGWDRPDNTNAARDPMTFNLAVVPAGSPVVARPGVPRLPADVVPALVFEVVSRDGWEAEFYDKPDLVVDTGIRQIFLVDPSAEVIRPPLQGWRVRSGKHRPLFALATEPVFSSLGFRLQFVAGRPQVSPCGPAEVEEELLETEELLVKTVEKADRERQAVDGLAKKVNRLRAELGRAGP